jgi:translation elongation factor EF-4
VRKKIKVNELKTVIKKVIEEETSDTRLNIANTKAGSEAAELLKRIISKIRIPSMAKQATSYANSIIDIIDDENETFTYLK